MELEVNEKVNKRVLEKEYFLKVLIQLKEEFDRVKPDSSYSAILSSSGVSLSLRRIFPEVELSWNNDYLVQLVNDGKLFRKVQFCESGYLNDGSFKNSESLPDYVFDIGMVRSIMVKVFERFGFKESVSDSIQDYKVEDSLDGKSKSLRPVRTGCNLELWNELQQIEKGNKKVSMQGVAMKYNVTPATVTNYRYYWVKCIDCGDILVFSSSRYKKLVDDKENFVCNRCQKS